MGWHANGLGEMPAIAPSDVGAPSALNFASQFRSFRFESVLSFVGETGALCIQSGNSALSEFGTVEPLPPLLLRNGGNTVCAFS